MRLNRCAGFQYSSRIGPIQIKAGIDPGRATGLTSAAYALYTGAGEEGPRRRCSGASLSSRSVFPLHTYDISVIVRLKEFA